MRVNDMNYVEEMGRKDSIKRRIWLALIVLVTFLLQTTKGFFFAPFGIHACLLIPATVCVAMFEREFSGLFYGLAAGMMLEAVSPDSVCFNSVMFTLIGFTTGILITYLMRNNLVSALIFTFVFTLVYDTLYCLFFYVLDSVEITLAFYFKYYFVSVFYTTIFTPLFYFTVRAIVKKYK